MCLEGIIFGFVVVFVAEEKNSTLLEVKTFRNEIKNVVNSLCLYVFVNARFRKYFKT